MNGGKVYINDELVKIVIDMNTDITNYDWVKLEVMDPKGNKKIVDPYEFDGRYITQYPSKNDISIPGNYRIQPIISILRRVGRGDTVIFTVHNLFE